MCRLITFNQQTTIFALELVMLQTWQRFSRQRLYPDTLRNIADPAIKQRLLLMDSGCWLIALTSQQAWKMKYNINSLVPYSGNASWRSLVVQSTSEELSTNDGIPLQPLESEPTVSRRMHDSPNRVANDDVHRVRRYILSPCEQLSLLYIRRWFQLHFHILSQLLSLHHAQVHIIETHHDLTNITANKVLPHAQLCHDCWRLQG